MSLTHDWVLNGEIIRSIDASEEVAGLPAAKGVLLPRVELPPPEYDPTSERLTGPAPEIGADAVTYRWQVEPLSDPEIRAAKRAQSAEIFAMRMAAGFPWTFGGAAETLQVYRDKDRANWDWLLRKCQAVGDPDQLLTQAGLPKVRCTSNASYDMTVSEALGMLAALEQWMIDQQQRDWDVADAIRDAEDPAAVDVEAMWAAP
jgi:hypothetical protein